MPRVPTTQPIPTVPVRPEIADPLLLMAAADMHAHGRLIDPVPLSEQRQQNLDQILEHNEELPMLHQEEKLKLHDEKLPRIHNKKLKQKRPARGGDTLG